MMARLTDDQLVSQHLCIHVVSAVCLIDSVFDSFASIKSVRVSDTWSGLVLEFFYDASWGGGMGTGAARVKCCHHPIWDADENPSVVFPGVSYTTHSLESCIRTVQSFWLLSSIPWFMNIGTLDHAISRMIDIEASSFRKQ